ncbi:MAG: ABC transporter permease, partial [Planctomycetaceae bacterium]
LITVALLISMSWEDAPQVNGPCWIIYPPSWADSEWINHLQDQRPSKPRVRVAPLHKLVDQRGRLRLPPHASAIELMPLKSNSLSGTQAKVVYHFPSHHYDAIAPAAAWFWSTWKQFESSDIHYHVAFAPYRSPQPSNMASLIRKRAIENVNLELIATMLLLSVQFFTCCHLYVSFTSQDRERGTLSALALAPVSLVEILVARFIFHLTLGLSVSALILVIITGAKSVHASSFLVLICVGIAWLCIGTVISSLTKSQSVASMLMFCYMLGGGTLFYLATQFPIFRLIRLATIENHAVTLLYASIRSGYLLSIPFALMLSLTVIWSVLAMSLFARMGWQS